ncbi:ABC-type polysaccharide/polyol phosphate export system, permease component [Longilinea arvoryzae]|uniref:Transport permease protein n=1 Tax=Longilinea arvoryzae TaxID=360412 RepID=A0A0S7BBL6_9CHLR|nr:ABC transporter permease [Longilinea arvoryzae]GAP15079.1 ABC-type polysaccharide/polyol phosphate export system, permease component [Longilinea arvoryzae]
MRFMAFASRNRKEILRDPLSVFFGIGFPLAILLLLSAIQANIPVNLFEIGHLAPGIAVFGLSFISLFSGTLLAKDRGEAFLMRLFSSPLTASDFILGYTLPLIPISLAQSGVCFIAAFALGMAVNLNVLLGLVVLIPTAVLFIGIGLLGGSLLNEKQVGGICGALLTNLSAWLSGTWFDLNLVGGGFKTIAYLLPFAHAVDATRAAVAGNYAGIFPHLWWVIGYALVISIIAVIAFRRKMSGDQI